VRLSSCSLYTIGRSRIRRDVVDLPWRVGSFAEGAAKLLNGRRESEKMSR
jgi:hypothetical protein